MNNRFEIDSFNADEWLAYGKLFSGNNIHQTWSSGEARRKKPLYSVGRAILFQGNRPLVMAQFYISKIPIIRIGVATCEWGPLWHYDDDKDITEVHLSEFLTNVRKEFVERRGLSIRFDLRSTFESEQDAHLINVFKKNGFKYNPQTRKYRTYILDLGLDMSEIRDRLHPKWRSGLKVSEKIGFKVEWGSSVEMFDRFRKVYNEMWAHKTFATGTNLDMIRETLTVAKQEEGFLISIINHQGEDIGASIDTNLGNTMQYFLGASSPKSRKNSNPGYFIKWAAIQKAKEIGLKWYDLGGLTDLPSGAGVDEFKKRMNGQYIIFPGRFEVRSGNISAILIEFSIKYFKKLRQLYINFKSK